MDYFHHLTPVSERVVDGVIQNTGGILTDPDVCYILGKGVITEEDPEKKEPCQPPQEKEESE